VLERFVLVRLSTCGRGRWRNVRCSTLRTLAFSVEDHPAVGAAEPLATAAAATTRAKRRLASITALFRLGRLFPLAPE